MSLTTPENVGKLQAALHAKAKKEPACRCYSLYDKIHRKDVLEHAWMRCRKNGGAAGMDAQSFEQIEAGGVERWLEELTKEIREKTYRPNAVRRENQSDDGTQIVWETGSRDGGGAESEAARMEELLLPGSSQPCVSGGGQPHPPSAASVVERKTPKPGCKSRAAFGIAPAQEPWAA